MSEWTLHTGNHGDSTIINVDWSDEDNVRQKTVVEISIRDRDKPRTLEVIVNGVTVATVVRK